MEKADHNLPTKADDEAILNFFIAMNDNLDVEGYACRQADTNRTYNDIKMGIKWQGHNFGDETEIYNCGNDGMKSPWIITTDDMAFTVEYIEGATCKTKGYLNATTTFNDIKSGSCVYVTVDINGIVKKPNIMEPQTTLTPNKKLKKLTGDRYRFYIGSDGVAKGNPAYTLSGRILAGEK